MLTEKIIKTIRDVPDFPKPGILFKDITPILHDPDLCLEIAKAFKVLTHTVKPDIVVGIESRGFLFGMLIAQQLHLPFVTIRKAGKLPYKTISQEYALEYGTATVEMHVDSIQHGQLALIHDDLLATGGTAEAAAKLIQKQGGKIAGFSFLVELDMLRGRKTLEPYRADVFSLVHF